MKYFTKEVKIALTAIVAVAALFAGINFLKGVNIFQPTNAYYVKFANISGLTTSNPVFANGYPVGTVRSIDYNYDEPGSILVGIELDDAMRVPAGTRAELSAELMGGVTMTLVLGPNPARVIEPGDTIEGGIHTGAMGELEKMVPAIAAMLPKLDSILANLNRLSADPALARTLHNAADITDNLKTSSEQLNTLLARDIPQLTARLNRVGANAETFTADLAALDLEATMDSVNATLGSVRQFSERLNNVTTTLDTKLAGRDNTLGLLINDRQLYDNLNKTVRSGDSLLIDLRQHPKRYVHFSIFGRKDK